MLFFSQFVRPTQRKLALPFGFILSCDQHRKPAFLSELYIAMLCDQHRKLACLFGLDLYYYATNTENWHAFFDFFYCSNNTEYCHFYLSSYYCTTNTENWRAFFDFFYCSNNTEYCRFYLSLYYCATNTENWRAYVMLPTQSTGVYYLRLYYCETNKENWRAFWGFLTYTIVRPTQKTGMPFWFLLLFEQHKILSFLSEFILLCNQHRKLAGLF